METSIHVLGQVFRHDDITMIEMVISSFRPNAVDESSFVRALSY